MDLWASLTTKMFSWLSPSIQNWGSLMTRKNCSTREDEPIKMATNWNIKIPWRKWFRRRKLCLETCCRKQWTILDWQSKNSCKCTRCTWATPRHSRSSCRLRWCQVALKALPLSSANRRPKRSSCTQKKGKWSQWRSWWATPASIALTPWKAC